MKRREVLKSVIAGAAAMQIIPSHSAGATQKKKKFARPFIKAADGTHLFFQDWGEGKTILFVAPWALTSDWWEYQIPFLSSQGFRCIAYDRRGHGRSDQPALGYEFHTLARDLAEIITQLDLHDITLVGHSMGCAEIVRYLSLYGSDRVAGAVLIATITPFTLKTEDNPSGFERTALESGRQKLAKDRPRQVAEAAPLFFGTSKNEVSNEVMQWWIRMIVDQCSMKTMLELHRAMTETDFRSDLQKIKLPTLLIHGDNDKSAFIDFTSRRTLPLLTNGQLKVYEGAAHGLPVTHMDRLNQDLIAFAQG